MVVRQFDLNPARPARLTVVQAPVRRRDLRRQKQRYAIAGFLSLLIPFAGALLVLGVVR